MLNIVSSFLSLDYEPVGLANIPGLLNCTV